MFFIVFYPSVNVNSPDPKILGNHSCVSYDSHSLSVWFSYFPIEVITELYRTFWFKNDIAIF